MTAARWAAAMRVTVTMGDNESRDGGHCSESASERCTPRGPVSPVGGVWPGPPRAHCRQNIWKTPSQKIACADVRQGTGEKWASPGSFRRGYHADVNATPACLCSDPVPSHPRPTRSGPKTTFPRLLVKRQKVGGGRGRVSLVRPVSERRVSPCPAVHVTQGLPWLPAGGPAPRCSHAPPAGGGVVLAASLRPLRVSASPCRRAQLPT